MDLFERLFKQQLPHVHKHFEVQEIRPEMYLIDWLLTLFSRTIKNPDITSRVWDNYLLHGEIFIFRTALGVLRCFKTRLRQMEIADCLKLLNNLPAVSLLRAACCACLR